MAQEAFGFWTRSASFLNAEKWNAGKWWTMLSNIRQSLVSLQMSPSQVQQYWLGSSKHSTLHQCLSAPSAICPGETCGQIRQWKGFKHPTPGLLKELLCQTWPASTRGAVDASNTTSAPLKETKTKTSSTYTTY